MVLTIAIDGPAASGKSSAAELVADELGFSRLDSGLLYRAITYILIEKGLVGEPAGDEAMRVVRRIELKWKSKRIIYNEEDITDKLHSDEIDGKVGPVAECLHVRERVHCFQHEIISNSKTGMVVDGRDIGTVVLPNAFLKVFITAKATTRAKRRTLQSGGDYKSILKKIEERDALDENRKHGPLKQAEDAVRISNDDMTLKETVAMIVDLFNKKIRNTRDL